MFRANDIDGELLGRLTNDDLKDIGVASFGHRKKLLEAIADLGSAPATAPEPPPADPPVMAAADGTAANLSPRSKPPASAAISR